MRRQKFYDRVDRFVDIEIKEVLQIFVKNAPGQVFGGLTIRLH